MELPITGIIIDIQPARSGTGSTGREWHLRDFVIQSCDKYAHKVSLSIKGNIARDFPYQKGEKVVCTIDIDAREYQGRWFNDVKCTKIDRTLL